MIGNSAKYIRYVPQQGRKVLFRICFFLLNSQSFSFRIVNLPVHNSIERKTKSEIQYKATLQIMATSPQRMRNKQILIVVVAYVKTEISETGKLLIF